jgi:hypothetical protein
MFQYQLKTHMPGTIYQGHYFFIQSKGLHSGKPLKEPYPNCFICQCNSEQQKEQLFWLLFSLWQGRKFHEVLVGSVIPFIRKRDLTNMIQLGLQKTTQAPEQFEKTVETLQILNKQELNYLNLSNQISQLKIVMINKLLA